jgi:hypothetical protein
VLTPTDIFRFSCLNETFICFQDHTAIPEKVFIQRRLCRRRQTVQEEADCAGGGRLCRRRQTVQEETDCAGGDRLCRGGRLCRRRQTVQRRNIQIHVYSKRQSVTPEAILDIKWSIYSTCSDS